ncbi:MAG TPA: nitrogenase-stabilizing/protective protein NifW [Pseudomonas sp.]|jgi:nitrogenase-stabilizing/protective protein|uniref:nitrogenase-stabilizing/protective protein NifW n=1 Tax=Pseudomonas sp. TaxID=306 RepID=UPI002ED9C5B5
MNQQPFATAGEDSFDEAMAELVSAEDFLEFFGVPFESRVVQISRLHIMQRYHDYLIKAGDMLEHPDPVRRVIYGQLLSRAYTDFVASDAQTEKVFKVFKQGTPQVCFVSIDELLS